MKIVHYCLGLPPFSTGGLSIYAHDLASIQAKDNDVYVLFPGIKRKKIHLKKINYKNNKNIKLYRMDGALPCALTYGVKEPLDFIKNKNLDEIKEAFLAFGKVDVLHLHTLQGIYPEVIKYFKENGTKIIFTTHDFYPFSLTTKLYKDELENEKNNIIQSLKAPSTKALYLNRKPLINNLKRIKFIKKIFNKKVKKEIEISYDLNYENEYKLKSEKLYSFYLNMLKDVDIIHANSNLSKEIYKKANDNVKVIPITHKNIQKVNILKNENKVLNIGFFGEELKDKGFNLLLNILDEIYKENNNFILNCYGSSNLYERPYLKYHGPYKFDDLKNIYKDIDLVIFPAINIESFGFVVLEALAYKTPVIVSENVGSKDLCNKDFIVNNENELKNMIRNLALNKNKLKDYFNYGLKIETLENHIL